MWLGVVAFKDGGAMFVRAEYLGIHGNPVNNNHNPALLEWIRNIDWQEDITTWEGGDRRAETGRRLHKHLLVK